MQKDLRIEKMRIIACLMVILNHVSASVYKNYMIGSFKWNVFNVYDCLSRGAVPVFVMISGILLLDNSRLLELKKIFKKYIPKMIIILVLGSLFYSIWWCFGTHYIKYSIKNIIGLAINGPEHLWYISVVLFLYLITPIFRCITKNDSKLVAQYCFWIFLVSSIFITLKSSSMLPYYSLLKEIIGKVYFSQLLTWSSYFLLGYYIYKTDYLDKYKKLAYVLGVVGLLLRIILTIFISTKTNTNDFTYYSNMGFPVFASSIALLFWMKSFKPKESHRKAIELFSKMTLGIYIIHIFFIECLALIFKINLANSFTIVTIPLATIIVFLVSFISVFIYKKLLSIIKVRCKNA